MVLGISINFSKSKWYGIGISPFELQTSSYFFGCKIEQFPCKFLGITIDGNQRKISFWNPVIHMLKSKLSTWKAIFLSVGVDSLC